MAIYRRRVPEPPSNLTGPLRSWCEDVARAINALPTFSRFSGTSPSGITGQAGDFASNLGSASTSSRWWGNTGLSVNTTNWVAIRVLE